VIRRAVLSVAAGHWYPTGQQRLFDSLEERGENATRLFWRDRYPPGCPTHEEVPYSFKPYAFQEARRLGFDQALWLDASCWLIRPLDTVWGRMADDGWFLEPDGNMVGEWISDQALELLQLGRDEALGMGLMEGKLIGLDFRNPVASRFLDEWTRLAELGGFNGAWSNRSEEVSTDARCSGHRHDIACGSPVAHRLGMAFQTEKRVGFPANGEPGDRILVMAQGL
jgi:hypothetical protein